MLRLDSKSLVDLIDGSYDLTAATVPWATGIVRVLMGLTSSRVGGAFHFTSGYDDGALGLRTLVVDVELGSDRLRRGGAALMRQAPSALSELMWGRTQSNRLSQSSGLGAELARLPSWRDAWAEPIVDCLGLVARDTDGEGFAASVGLDSVGTLTSREAGLLAKVATHVGAGDRLRRANHRHPLDTAEAILSSNGKLLHAVERAKQSRDSLDEGRRRRDEARKTRHDAEKALEIWKGLVTGRWSLVDHFDTDGQRFLLAMKNAPHVDRRADLTPRERRVAALAAMGHRDKEIAYMLGLSLASVSAAVHRARGKLGVRTRAELAAVWRRCGDV